MNDLFDPETASPPCNPSGRLSAEAMAKAVRMWGSLEPVGETARLMNPRDADKIVASVDAAMTPCTAAQASGYVAQLIYAYPQLGMADRSREEDRNFKLYTVKLHEAFSIFSPMICEAIVHGGTGVPSLVAYKPQPSDVVGFGKKLIDRLVNAKTMAQRHKAEADRRERARQEDEKYRRAPLTPEQRQRVTEALASLRSA